jgi:cytochrome c-type biogenesis protein CcmH
MLRKSILILVMLVGTFLLARTVLAQAATPSDDDVNQIAKKLFCPVCENVPLDVCPTQACTQWRATIKEKLVAGWSEQQILDYFVAQYGERVLAQPSTRGLNILVWLVPPLLVLAGAFALWRFLRQMSHATPKLATAPFGPSSGSEFGLGESDPSGDEYIARVEQELKRRR